MTEYEKAREEYDYGRGGNRDGNRNSTEYARGLRAYDRAKAEREASVKAGLETLFPSNSGSSSGGGGYSGGSTSGGGIVSSLEEIADSIWPLKKLAGLGEEMQYWGWKVCLPSALLAGYGLLGTAHRLLSLYAADLGLPTAYIPLAAIAISLIAGWLTPKLLGFVLRFLALSTAGVIALLIIALGAYILYLIGSWVIHLVAPN